LRICFLNPFGTNAYNALIDELLTPAVRPDVDLQIRNLDTAIEYMDYFAAKHLLEVNIMKQAVRSERDGFDALIIDCCYDPALTPWRELVNIPVIGPLEAGIGNIRPFGHRYAIVTDHHKAATGITDRVRVYGPEANSRAVSSIGWYIDDMITDPASVAAASGACTKVTAETGAETVIIDCAIVAACYQVIARKDAALQHLSVVDSNIIALKQAQMFR
jgi:allantoin racemase